MATLKLKVNGQSLSVSCDISKIVENSIDYLKYEIETTDDDWNNLSAVDVIFNYNGQDIIGIDGKVPTSVIHSPGFTVNIVGYNITGGIKSKQITTDVKAINVYASGSISGTVVEEEDLEADWLSSIQATVASALSAAQTAETNSETAKNQSSNAVVTANSAKTIAETSAQSATESAIAAEEAQQSAKESEEAVINIRNNIANAIKKDILTEQGEYIYLKDISSIEHELETQLFPRNLLVYPYANSTSTIQGVTFIDNGDGTITVNASGTGETEAIYQPIPFKQSFTLPAGTYTLSGGSSDIRLQIYLNDVLNYVDSGKGKTFTITEDKSCRLNIRVNKTVITENTTVYPQLELGAEKTEWQSYINPSTMTLKTSGKNLWKQSTISVDNSIEEYSLKQTFYHPITISMEKSNSLIVSSSIWRVRVGYADGTFIYFTDSQIQSQKFKSFNATIDNPITKITMRKTNITAGKYYNIQVELGEQVTNYEEYKTPISYVADEDGTVKNIKSIFPNMIIYPSITDVTIKMSYNQDTNKVIEDIEDEITKLAQNSGGSSGTGGTSITITDIFESNLDGGSNIVTFSDGSILTIKNGSKGSQGIQGVKGETGAAGPQGEQGEKGEKGDTGEKGVKGEDGYTPIKGTDYFTENDKEEIIESVIESLDNIPEYWQTALDDGADKIREAMENAGRNKSTFLFYSDAHWDEGSKNAPMLLNYLTANTAINKTIFGGDIVSDEPTSDTISDRTIMAYLWKWRNQIRNLKHYSVVGNHDDGNTTNNIFSADYVYSYLFAPEENNNITRDADTYYYFDDNREKTRYLCLDTAYESLSFLSTAQTTFIKEALISTPEDWHIVVVAHIWYMPDYDQYDIRPVPLTGLSNTAMTLTALLDSYNSRTDEFADCKAKIEFCIGGHIHYDYVGATDGGIPIILCETASLNIRGNFTYALGTTTETAVSGIIADYNNNKLTVIRVGRGNNFEVDLSNPAMETRYSITTNLINVSSSSAVTQVAEGDAYSTTLTVTLGEISSVVVTMGGTDITSSVYDESSGIITIDAVTGNVVITAIATDTDPSYTNVLDTVGYVEGYRLSGGSGNLTENADTDVTNYIPCESGTLIYMKNVIAPYTDANEHYHFISHYDKNKAHIGGFDILKLSDIEYDSDGNITSFRTNTGTGYTGAVAYIRIGAQDINDNSIITVNEPIE